MVFETEITQKGPLTDREAEILQLICEAKSDKDIARLLDVSTRTVMHHIEHIYKKLGICHSSLNRRLLVFRTALQLGLVKLLCLVLCVGFLMPDGLSVLRPPSLRVSASRRVD